MIDVEWNSDFEWYFKRYPNGTLSAAVTPYAPLVCQSKLNTSVTVHARDGRARLVAAIPPDLYDCSNGEPIRTAYLMISLIWVSRTAPQAGRGLGGSGPVGPPCCCLALAPGPVGPPTCFCEPHDWWLWAVSPREVAGLAGALLYSQPAANKYPMPHAAQRC